MTGAGAAAGGRTPTTGVGAQAPSVKAAPNRPAPMRAVIGPLMQRPPPLSVRAAPPATPGPRRPRSPAGSSQGSRPRSAAITRRQLNALQPLFAQVAVHGDPDPERDEESGQRPDRRQQDRR